MPAYRISKLQNGTWYYLAITMEYRAPDSLERVVERVLAGRTAFVRREDLQGLLASVDQKVVITGR